LVTTEHEKADWVTFSVRDYGKGIEKKQMSKVFEPFKTDKPNGFGLGLSMVKVIADAHGGEIKANSTVGKGTTFSLLLPVFKEKD
jgi:signal transduction histidine kinase